MVGLDNCYSSPQLSVLLTKLQTHAVGTVISNRKALPGNIMGRKLKKGEVEVSIRRRLMALKWKDKRDICMLNSIHNEEKRSVHDNKGSVKQTPKLRIYYNAMGSLTFLIRTL
jgi:hypothetical protein